MIPGVLNITITTGKVEEVFKTKEHLKRIGANYLLNIGPDHLGRFPAPAMQVLKDLARMNGGWQ